MCVHNEEVNRNILLIESFHLYIIVFVHNEKVSRKRIADMIISFIYCNICA